MVFSNWRDQWTLGPSKTFPDQQRIGISIVSSHENLNNERKHKEFENWIYVYFRFGMNDFDSLEDTPWTVNGWNLQNDTIYNWKWSEPNLHGCVPC